MMLFVFSLYFSVFSIFNIFLLLKVMLSCGAAIFHSSPTSNTSVKTVLIISIYPPSFFSVLAWAFLNKNQFTVFYAKLIKRFHRVNMVILGICIVYIDTVTDRIMEKKRFNLQAPPVYDRKVTNLFFP